MKKFGQAHIRVLLSLSCLCAILQGYILVVRADGSGLQTFVTVRPQEVWVTAGQTATVTFVGTTTGQHWSATDISGNVIRATGPH